MCCICVDAVKHFCVFLFHPSISPSSYTALMGSSVVAFENLAENLLRSVNHFPLKNFPFLFIYLIGTVKLLRLFKTSSVAINGGLSAAVNWLFLAPALTPFCSFSI